MRSLTNDSDWEYFLFSFSFPRYLITDDKVSRRAVLIIFVNFGSDQYQLETKIFDYDEYTVRDKNS